MTVFDRADLSARLTNGIVSMKPLRTETLVWFFFFFFFSFLENIHEVRSPRKPRSKAMFRSVSSIQTTEYLHLFVLVR